MSLIQPFLHPKRIAVVGASRTPGKVGYRIVQNLLASPNVEVLPINPNADEVLGKKAFPTLVSVGQEIDVVVVATPAATIDAVISDCIAAKVKAIVLITAGFAEMGTEGKAEEQKITQRLKEANIALLGPNTMGYVYTPSGINASFGPAVVPAGNVAVLSQSGAMLSALFQAFESSNVGVSLAVSLGNKAGVSENDFLQELEDDPHTSVVALYLESFAHLPTFFESISRVVRKKPVFLLKGGSTAEGVKASSSHTAALATSSALLQDAAQQIGFILVDSMEELIRVSIVASQTPDLPENVVVVTNAGGPSVVMIDELQEKGVPLSKFTERTVQDLSDHLPGIHIANPLDLLGDAGPERFSSALEILKGDPAVDSMAFVITQQAVTDIPAIADTLYKAHSKKAVFVSLPAGDAMAETRQDLRHKGVFAVEYPNQTVDILKHLVRAGRVQNNSTRFTPLQESSEFGYPDSYQSVCELLTANDFVLPKQVIVHEPQELDLVGLLQYPVIAKTTNLELKHKANVGAVITNIATLQEARAAYPKLIQWDAPVVYQEYVRQGVEVLVGCAKHEQFGWYMAFGVGGSFANMLADRVHVFLPTTQTQMQNAMRRTKLIEILNLRQQAILLDFLMKIQHMAGSIHKVTELEFNPVFISETQAVIADLKRV